MSKVRRCVEVGLLSILFMPVFFSIFYFTMPPNPGFQLDLMRFCKLTVISDAINSLFFSFGLFSRPGGDLNGF